MTHFDFVRAHHYLAESSEKPLLHDPRYAQGGGFGTVDSSPIPVQGVTVVQQHTMQAPQVTSHLSAKTHLTSTHECFVCHCTHHHDSFSHDSDNKDFTQNNGSISFHSLPPCDPQLVAAVAIPAQSAAMVIPVCYLCNNYVRHNAGLPIAIAVDTCKKCKRPVCVRHRVEGRRGTCLCEKCFHDKRKKMVGALVICTIVIAIIIISSG